MEGPNGQKSVKIGPLDPSFRCFCPCHLVRSCSFFSGIALVANRPPEKIWASSAFLKPEKQFRSLPILSGLFVSTELHSSKKIWNHRINFRWRWRVTNNNSTDIKRRSGGSNYYPLANRHQLIPLSYWTVVFYIVERIYKLLTYEKFTRKRFKKAVQTLHRLRTNDLLRKRALNSNLGAFESHTAAEPLRHLQADQKQIYSIYSLALFKWQKKISEFQFWKIPNLCTTVTGLGLTLLIRKKMLRIFIARRFVTFFLKAKNWTGEAVQLCDRKI